MDPVNFSVLIYAAVVLGSLRTVVTNGTILSQIMIYRKSHEEKGEKKVK